MNTTKIKRVVLCCCFLAVGQISVAAGPSLTIKDTIGREWLNEPIVWELPGAKADTVRLQRDGQLIPAQVVAIDGRDRGAVCD